MYKSPIEVYQDEMRTFMDGEILKAVQRVGVHVDKEELLKALEYDRDQYDKGYADGVNASKWIPISSGNLPDENTKVWCINADGETMAGCVRLDEDEQDFTAWGSVGACHDYMLEVVAWMPIVPYKEGE